MKIAATYPKKLNMLVRIILTFALVSCSMHNYNSRNYKLSTTPVLNPLPISRNDLMDTIHFKFKDTQRTAPIPHSMKYMIKSGALPSYPDLLKEHFEADSASKDITQRLFRAQDSSRTRGKRNDTLLTLLIGMDKRERIAQSEAHKYFQQAQKAHNLEIQNQTYSKSIDWQFWIAVATLILFLAGNSIMLVLIRKAQKRTSLHYV